MTKTRKFILRSLPIAVIVIAACALITSVALAFGPIPPGTLTRPGDGYDLQGGGGDMANVVPVNGGYFLEWTTTDASGTGVYEPFLHADANRCDLLGYSTSAYNQAICKLNGVSKESPQFDETAQWTHAVELSDLPKVDVGGVQCYEMTMDDNQQGSLGGELLTLEIMDVYQTDDQFIYPYSALQSQPLAWSLDTYPSDDTTQTPTTDRYVLFDATYGDGSGKLDVKIFIPVGLFDPSYDYVVVYMQWGDTSGNELYCDNDGFEELGYIIYGCADLSITKTASDASIGCPGESITYTVTVLNDGPADASGVYVVDTIPNITVTNVLLNGTTTLTLGVDYTISGNELRYPAAGGILLDADSSITLDITGTANDCDPLDNSATVYVDTANDCDETDNTAAASTVTRVIPTIVPSLITDKNVASCQSQADIDSDYAAWAAGLSFSGGCNRVDTIVIPDPPAACGGYATVTWSVTSDCEDTISGSATYTVADAPVLEIDCPEDIWAENLNNINDCPPIPDPEDYPVVTNACGDVDITYDDAPGDGCGVWVRTWTATDNCNTVSCDQIIHCLCEDETACAAQDQPGETIFGKTKKNDKAGGNWFTYIEYTKAEVDVVTEFPIYAGQTHRAGTLYVKIDADGILWVNYSTDGADDPDRTWFGISEYHLEVVDNLADFADDAISNLLNKQGSPVPGQAEYANNIGFGTETGWIETEDVSGYSDPIFIFAHGIFWWGYDS